MKTSATFLVFFGISFFLFVINSKAITTDIPNRVCPGQTYSFYVDNLPFGTTYWECQVFQDGNSVASYNGGQNNQYPGSISFTFNSQFGSAKIVVKAFLTAIQPPIETYIKDIDKRPPPPPSPNNGLVIGCSN